ncbi:odorant receptor 13a [Drosophila bipectinata]|uniref:odorant receptor 13a n=1 Tax=Drosophila bipectinata TaxID=42026 RepID=UPI0038B24A70
MTYTVWAWYVIGSVGITICYQTGFLMTHLSDIIMTTENCCTTFMGALNFIRLIHLRVNQNKFRSLIESFYNDIWISNITNPIISTKCQKRMRTFIIMTALLSCLIILYCAMPLIELLFTMGSDSNIKPFPYKMVFPYDPYCSSMAYVFTYIFTSYAGICVVTTLFAEDSLFGFFITYTCCQFQLLHEKIIRLFMTEKEFKDNDPKDGKIYCKRLKSIVKKHNKIIRFSKQLEDFFNPILLFNLIISSILICMVGFQIITGKNIFIGDYVKFLVYIFSAISQLYILCENGDTLISHRNASIVPTGKTQVFI